MAWCSVKKKHRDITFLPFTLTGDIVAPTSEVRISAMLVLLMLGSGKVQRFGGF
jgi:hypothetical protein